MNASQIVLSETTNLPDVAGKVVLSDVLRKFVDKETPAQLIARLEKMGLVIDDEIITAVTRTYNDKISKNTPPAPIEIDHVNRVASWLAEKAN